MFWPIIQRLKDTYLIWFSYYHILPRTHRFSLGQKIDTLFIEIIETTAETSFSVSEEKLIPLRIAIKKLDTLKLLLMILWESKSLDNKKYIALSEKLNEIGKMLGGWKGQLIKQNSPNK